MSLPPTCLFLSQRDAHGNIDLHYVGSPKKLNKVDRRAHLAPLHMAAQWTSAQRVRELIAKGAIVDIRSDEHACCITPLFSAACHCNIGALDALLLAGADVEARDSNGRTALMYAVTAFENWQHRVACVRKLVAAGVPLNAQNEGGATALHFAVQAQSVELTTLLLELGIDQNLCLINGRTPLYTACTKNCALLELLLACPGTNLDAQTNDQKATALHCAAFYGDLEMVYMLLAAGANPRIKNAAGMLPSHCALEGSGVAHSRVAAILAVWAIDVVCEEVMLMKEDGTMLNLNSEIRQRAERLALARQKLQNAKDNRVLRLKMGCAVCKAPTSNSCAACRRVYYCSNACQHTDWKAHKKECKKTADGSENAN